MLKIKNPNILNFSSDNDFYRFCVVPVIVPREYVDTVTGQPAYYMDFDFSNQYVDAVKNGVKFCINDEDSQIYKHGCVSYRTITKPVENLIEYIKM